jgi:hypothetical protein
MRSQPCLWLALGLLFFLPHAAGADDAYYVIVFGSQRPIFFEANHTHSFALFVRAASDKGGTPHVRETLPISWMPQAMELHVCRLCPEPGFNLDIPATLDWAYSDGQRVSRWGPFAVEKELYDRAARQLAHLKSGTVRYKTVDTGFRTDRVSNCIHAVSDVLRDAPRLRICAPTWGQAASYFITLSFGDYFVEPHVTHEWVIDAVGLRDYPMVARDLGDRNPTRWPLLRAAQSGLRLGARQTVRRD